MKKKHRFYQSELFEEELPRRLQPGIKTVFLHNDGHLSPFERISVLKATNDLTRRPLANC